PRPERQAVPVVIRPRAQVDLNAVAARARLDRGRDGAQVSTVVEALQAQAERTQTSVRQLLDAEAAAGRTSDIRSYRVVNSFSATVDQQTLDRLAVHPDVESIGLDEELVLPEPAT
ncbi:MAG: protease inhibitor I9 family protein, partial [Acidimicrobiales bacterium]